VTEGLCAPAPERVSRQALRYLELVSGLLGDRAIDAWIRYTGYPEGEPRSTVEIRLENAERNAIYHFGIEQKEPICRIAL
jgi:hypothetical protein